MNDVYQDTLANPRFQAILFGVFAGLTLCLAVAGVYTVVAYEANSRTREIGIRIALGAGSAAVTRHIMRRFLLLACGGIAIGILVGMAMTRLMIWSPPLGGHPPPYSPDSIRGCLQRMVTTPKRALSVAAVR